MTTLKQCFSLAICFQRSSLFNHPKFFGTSPQLWCHKTMYYFLKKTSCPEKPLDLTVLPIKHYFSKVGKKDTTTKAFVLINHCFINFFFFGLEVMFKIIPFLAPQWTLWETSGVGDKVGEGGWSGWCRIKAWWGRPVIEKGISKVLSKWWNNLKFV